jgi:hypothetical protein
VHLVDASRCTGLLRVGRDHPGESRQAGRSSRYTVPTQYAPTHVPPTVTAIILYAVRGYPKPRMYRTGEGGERAERGHGVSGAHRPCRVHFRLMVLPPYIR